MERRKVLLSAQPQPIAVYSDGYARITLNHYLTDQATVRVVAAANSYNTNGFCQSLSAGVYMTPFFLLLIMAVGSAKGCGYASRSSVFDWMGKMLQPGFNEYSMESGVIKLNGTTVYTFTPSGRICTAPISVGREYGMSGDARYDGSIKFVEVEDGDYHVRLGPRVQNGIAGLFDVISGQFYPSTGEHDWTAVYN